MSTTVCKFGGSSLCDAEMFRRVLDIIKSDANRRFIVLSAPGKRNPQDEKITDRLYRAYGADAPQDDSIFSGICERYTQISRELCPDLPIEEELRDIRSKLHSSPDYIASRGEYLCARVFSSFSGIKFVDAADLICFYQDGSLDFQSTREKTRSRLSMLDYAVIPGFYGALPDGCIKTFDRGGSDVSGAIIAAALDADLYENWTDVDGLFTADPNLIPSARRNPVVSLKQMRSIAQSGANVLHPDSLEVLQNTHIDTVIRNTFTPDCTGTRISENFNGNVFCVTARRDLTPPLFGTKSCCLGAGEKGCIISVFGLDASAMRRIHSRLKNICIIHMHDHFKIITQNDRFETSLREIHALFA